MSEVTTLAIFFDWHIERHIFDRVFFEQRFESSHHMNRRELNESEGLDLHPKTAVRHPPGSRKIFSLTVIMGESGDSSLV
jgi:urease beta subunit